MESRTQCDKRTVWKLCHLQKKIKNTQDGVAGENSRREKGSQPADVPQGISETVKRTESNKGHCEADPDSAGGTDLTTTMGIV